MEARQLYSLDPRVTSWVKVKNPTYSQGEGRAELFHRSTPFKNSGTVPPRLPRDSYIQL